MPDSVQQQLQAQLAEQSEALEALQVLLKTDASEELQQVPPKCTLLAACRCRNLVLNNQPCTHLQLYDDLAAGMQETKLAIIDFAQEVEPRALGGCSTQTPQQEHAQPFLQPGQHCRSASSLCSTACLPCQALLGTDKLPFSVKQLPASLSALYSIQAAAWCQAAHSTFEPDAAHVTFVVFTQHTEGPFWHCAVYGFIYHVSFKLVPKVSQVVDIRDISL